MAMNGMNIILFVSCFGHLTCFAHTEGEEPDTKCNAYDIDPYERYGS